MKNVMLDLETLGTGNDAAIISIGACLFDPRGDGVLIGVDHRFYARVNPASSVEIGMKIDVSTILWWMQQSDAARKSTFEGDSLWIQHALKNFDEFIKQGH